MNFKDEINKLKAENEELRLKVNKSKQRKERKEKATKKTLSWTWKLFTGKSLNKSFNQWFQEFHNNRNVSADTSANLLTALVRRFVRVRLLSLILLLFSLIPSMVSLYVLIKQNVLIETQNSLVEGSRKSAYGFQLSNIYDAVDRAGNNISDNIVGRIVGLSYNLKPYKILEANNKLSKKPYSPERTQLLLFIVNSSISQQRKSEIFKKADFSHCDLRNMNLSGRYLAGANLSNSNFDNAKLMKTNLAGANLTESSMKNVNFSDINAVKTIFIKTNFEKSAFRNADFRETVLTDAEFKNVRLRGCILDNAYFEGSLRLNGSKASEDYIENTYIIEKDDEGFNALIKK